jgi:hypothetical protein
MVFILFLKKYRRIHRLPKTVFAAFFAFFVLFGTAAFVKVQQKGD